MEQKEEERVFKFYIPLHINPDPVLQKIEAEYETEVECLAVSSRTIRYCGKRVRLWSLRFRGQDRYRALDLFDQWLEVRGDL